MSRSETDALTAPAPQAPQRVPEDEYNYILRVNPNSNINFQTLNAYLAATTTTYTHMGGVVDLIKMEVAYICTEASISVQAGFRPTGSSASIKAVSMKENGHYHVSNAFNCGIKNIVTLIPEHNLSRRCKPFDSGMVQLDFSVACSDWTKANCAVFFYLKCHGPITEFI